MVPFASDFDQDICYINVWTSHNAEGNLPGVKYATLTPREDARYNLCTAPRHYFVETLVDEYHVGQEILREREATFRQHSKKSARPLPEEPEEPESSRESRSRIRERTPGVHEDSR